MSNLVIKRDEESGLMVMDISEAAVGRGSEQMTSEDRSIPWFKLLQGGSPEIKTARSRVDGARPGMFYNTATGELFDGEDGSAEIVICTTERSFVEWASEANGAGFVGKHDPSSPAVREALAHSKENDLFPPQRSNGNELTDTRYLYVLVGDNLEPAVFAISSKKLKTYKDLMAKYHSWRVLNSNGKKVQPSLCMFRVKCTSFDDHAAGFDFSNLIMAPAVNNSLDDSVLSPDDPRVVAGLAVADLYDANKIKVDYAGEHEARDAEVIDVKTKDAF